MRGKTNKSFFFSKRCLKLIYCFSNQFMINISSTVCGGSLVCWFVKFLWAFNPFYGSHSSDLFLSPWNLMFSGVLERQERHKMNYAVLFKIFILVRIVMIYLTQNLCIFETYYVTLTLKSNIEFNFKLSLNLVYNYSF